ncbi:MAG: metallophosphoesterase family protein [Acidobacteriota bacterium]
MRQLLHISDIHFGPNFRAEVAEGVQELVARTRPDLVVISGDVTRRAKRRQFEDALAWVRRLQAPWIVVPGNHDVPAYRVWERLLDPYGSYRRHFQDELEPVFEDDELFVLGVNTAFKWTVKDGRFTQQGLRRMERLLTEAPSGKARIVVAHHQLTPPPRYDTQRVAERAVEALDVMRRCGVEAVLSGHQHQTYVTLSEEYQPRGGPPTLLIHSGTTTSSRGRGWERGRNSCNWLTVDRERLSVRHLLWSEEERSFYEWQRRVFPRVGQRPYRLGGAFDPTRD